MDRALKPGWRRVMTAVPFQHLVEELPMITVEQWTGFDGWPEFRIGIRASLFGFANDERFLVRREFDSAMDVARILAEATGFPVSIRP
jgi:hypothetical protein